MSAALTLPLMTAEQFFGLPDPAGDYTYELHFGELVPVGRAKTGHYQLQRLIRDILIRSLGSGQWTIDIEMPYGLTAGFDARAADVGVCARAVFEAIPFSGYLIGSPLLVVHVKSRSNRDRKLEEDALAHITHGAVGVWLVKPERREVVMITAVSRTVYGPGDRIELPAPLAAVVAVDDIYSGRGAEEGFE
jgi:Uma2 family endonuclease